MRALDRKLLRDLGRMWSQALTIALVVASGVAGFVTTLSSVDSLARARDDFYREARFADVFASVQRAPRSLVDTLRDLPGVADAEDGLSYVVRVEREGRTEPIIGQLVSLDARHDRRLNRVVLRGAPPGATPRTPGGLLPDGSIPAWVSESFAQAHGLQPGARLSALVNGKRRTLTVAGVALAPDYVFAGLFGMPDQRGYGVFWIDREILAAAWSMEGAFTHLAFRLAPGADERALLDALERRLAPYGGRQPHGRADQPSHAMLDAEIREQRLLGTVLPVVFLGVAAFLLDVVISRLVATQREQIAALKALGYDDRTIARHYLALVGAVVAGGLVVGLAAGKVLGTAFTGLYAGFFRFPRFDHHLGPGLVAVAAGLTALTALVGTFTAIGATVRLAPAEAMRPPAPGRFRRSRLEALAPSRGSPAMRMVLRQMERRPLRTAMSIGGVAFAVALVVMGNFFRDAIDHIVDTQFEVSLRGDLAVWTLEPVQALGGVNALRALQGVNQVEPSRFVPVRFVAGHRRERGEIRGYATHPDLYRIVDADQHTTDPAGDGLVMTDRLAAKLGVRVGDRLRVEVLDGRARTLDLPVDAVVRETMGLNAYMNRDALNRALGDGDLAGGFTVSVEPGAEATVLEATRGMPRVVGAFSKASMLSNMQEVSARNVRIMSTVLTVFAAVIAVGIVYNDARIALAERAWELASLRVLGFSRAEVSAMLLGELALVIALALPLGMALGRGLVWGLTGALRSDQFLFPVVIRPPTYAMAALAVVAAGVASALVVRRRIDRLDLVAVLKTRD